MTDQDTPPDLLRRSGAPCKSILHLSFLPAAAYPPAVSENTQPDTARAQLAAQLAVGAPFCLFVLLTLIGLLRSHWPAFNSDAVNFIVNLLTALWLLFSLGACIYTLAAVRRLGLRSLLYRAVIGLALVLLFLLNFGHKWHQQRVRYDEAIANASTAYVRLIQAESKSYDAANQRFINSPALHFAELTSREKIRSSREAVRQFIMANSSLAAFIRDDTKKFEAELRKNDLPETAVQSAVARFAQANGSRQKLFLKIRDCDDRMGRATLAILEMLDAHFGNWAVDPKSGLVAFKDKSLVKEFNAIVAQLQVAGQEQAAAQRQLLQDSPKAATPSL